MSDYAEKVRSIATPRKWGQARTIVKRDERDGSTAGYEKEHWDDRRDATVTPKPVKYRLSKEDG